MMTHLVLRNTRFFVGAVAVGASQQASSSPICSVLIALSQNSDTTHSFKNLADLGCIAILPQSTINTQANRELIGVSFAAINPQSTISAQANRGFSAGTFAAIWGAV